jgi:cytochrome c
MITDGVAPVWERGPGRSHVNYFVSAAVFVAASLVLTAAARADGDPEAGKQVFKKCHACHNVGEGAHNAVGPVLNGIVGRKAGTYEGYHYSEANEKSGITWTPDELKKYLAAPQKVVPGTKMAFPGLPNEKDIDNVIAYLATFGPDGKTK